MTTITIDWTYGRPRTGAHEDEARAIGAAERVLDAYEWRKGEPMVIPAEEAYAAWTRHNSDEDYYRSPRETILISAWKAAESAANIALTEGWHDQNGGGCVIRPQGRPVALHAANHATTVPVDWQGDVDSDGMPCIWNNHYHCDECDEEWEDTWSCQCDDECPSCGRDFSPYQSDDLTEAEATMAGFAKGSSVRYIGNTVPCLNGRIGTVDHTDRKSWVHVDFGDGMPLPCAPSNLVVIQGER